MGLLGVLGPTMIILDLTLVPDVGVDGLIEIGHSVLCCLSSWLGDSLTRFRIDDKTRANS